MAKHVQVKEEMKAVSDLPQGKVNSLKVSDIYNCCEPCCEAIVVLRE